MTKTDEEMVEEYRTATLDYFRRQDEEIYLNADWLTSIELRGYERGLKHARENPSPEVVGLRDAALFAKSEFDVIHEKPQHFTAWQRLRDALAAFDTAQKGKK